jgi:hypothetical protein
MNRESAGRSITGRPFVAAAVALLMVLSISGTAWAQLKGHYIPGFTGLDNGSQPPPSITLAVPFYFYPTDTIKDGDGRTIGINPTIKVAFTGLSLVVVTNAQLFGANYGFQVVPADGIRSRIESNSLDVPGAWGFSDITVAPLWLGWHTSRADITAGWSFFIPTGKWEEGGRDNSGLGMWSNVFQLGTTAHLDTRREWSTSVLGTYEIHTHKKDSTLKVGDILTFEGGTGRAFYQKVSGTELPRIIKVGVVYYAEFKVTADEGAGPIVDEFFANNKDRVFGVGGEASVFLPRTKLLLDARLVPEFGAHTRTQGLTFLFTVGYQIKSLARQP